jgi:hypothetical protein
MSTNRQNVNLDELVPKPYPVTLFGKAYKIESPTLKTYDVIIEYETMAAEEMEGKKVDRKKIRNLLYSIIKNCVTPALSDEDIDNLHPSQTREIYLIILSLFSGVEYDPNASRLMSETANRLLQAK